MGSTPSRFNTDAYVASPDRNKALADIADHGHYCSTPNTVQVEEGQRLELRVKVDTDMPGADYGHLLLYDGDPQKGGRLIADKQAFTGNPDGSHVWAEWTATQPGPHRLYAQLVESSVDTHTGNAIDDLEVVVHAVAPQPAVTSEDNDGCAIARTDGDASIWLFLVTVVLWARRKIAQLLQPRGRADSRGAVQRRGGPCGLRSSHC